MLLERVCRGWLLTIGCAVILGCGGDSQQKIDESGQIEMIAMDLPDMMSRPEMLNEKFVAGGAPPADAAQKYRMLVFRPKKTTINGEEATMLVQIENAQGTSLGEIEWPAVKENGVWKLKAAPLP
jgi:hypothetical protein